MSTGTAPPPLGRMLHKSNPDGIHLYVADASQQIPFLHHIKNDPAKDGRANLPRKLTLPAYRR